MSKEIETKQIATLIHGRYHVVRAAAPEDAPLLVGCHGYGENATRHLEKLRQIPGVEKWTICAIEGLHRFYNTRTGDVLGSWMTSQDRELAIDDNVRYVASVIAVVRRSSSVSNQLVFAGFSQGVAMAYRAAARSGFECQGLIALAGDVPPDVAAAGLAGFPPVLLGRGTEDEWYTEEKMDSDLETLKAMEAAVTTCVFDGGHDWTPEFYSAAGDFLARFVG